jgi:hypothetical protein
MPLNCGTERNSFYHINEIIEILFRSLAKWVGRMHLNGDVLLHSIN